MALALRLRQKPARRKGELTDVALGIVTAVVALFIGLYMISKVSSVASIDNTSDFYNTFSSLVTNTGTIYDVIVLVLIVVALGIAIAVLKGFSGGRTITPTSQV